MEYVYFILAAVAALALVALLLKVRRWIGRSTKEGLEQSRRFALVHGLRLVEEDGKSLQGELDGFRVTVDCGTLLLKAFEGKVGQLSTLRIDIKEVKGQWLLCDRVLAPKLHIPLHKLGNETPLQDAAAEQLVLRCRKRKPNFVGDHQLLQALADARLKMGSCAEGRLTLHFESPTDLLGGLGGREPALSSVLLLSLAVARPRRRERYLEQAAEKASTAAI